MMQAHVGLRKGVLHYIPQSSNDMQSSVAMKQGLPSQVPTCLTYAGLVTSNDATQKLHVRQGHNLVCVVCTVTQAFADINQLGKQ